MSTPTNPLLSKLAQANENTWMRFGALCENMHDPEKALYCYENSLRHNLYNVKALTQAASICRMREQYPKAVEYFQRILNVEQTNGEIWGALGHCYLMMDDLQKAYTAYQQALYHLPNPKDPNLWYGIGILYDRYGSFEHAEEAFTAVLKMDPKFEKANEIYFRLGIIYKQQMKHEQALDCFRYILQKPPRPLVQADIWFQIGHVYELQKDFHSAKDAYERVLKENPTHAKVLQQLGWLYHHNTTFGNQEIAISYLMRSIDADPSDGQTWYLLGRCYMAQQKYRKAYDAYQQAVYRDGRNPTFWCSIGVLYYQINQYRDALDAYSRAIRLNPYLSEVWYDLGTLYESCNQISDSLDAYQRAAELDPNNKHIQQRLSMLRAQISGGGSVKPTVANSSNNKDVNLPPSESGGLSSSGGSGSSGANGGSGGGKDVDGEKNGDMEKPGPIMTLEPRTSSAPGHSLSEGMGTLRRPPSANGALPIVADLVDLSRDEKPRLPSATELNSSLSDVKTQQKTVQEDDTKPSVKSMPPLASFGDSRESDGGDKNRDVEMGEAPSLPPPPTKFEKDSNNNNNNNNNNNSEMRFPPPPTSSRDDDYYDRDDDDERSSELRISDSQTIEQDPPFTSSSSSSATTTTSTPPTTNSTTTSPIVRSPATASGENLEKEKEKEEDMDNTNMDKTNNSNSNNSSINREEAVGESTEAPLSRGIKRGSEEGEPDQSSKKRKGVSEEEGEIAEGSNSDSDSSEKAKKLKSPSESKKRK